eukprot:CAMPEP_0181307788 /NCGR_PEP_ID=MMETSP1101-20121128/11086_1 /TAXON_ID=46948 /ORGANISM="Rhodomonas abbreviata, Strain Caron Lab Isolate" /LENGTH=223 /DNA_ID=CAMNT_0023414067 /DNA_START=68 /DNA_END=739 /DNA_ORIENTATION=+
MKAAMTEEEIRTESPSIKTSLTNYLSLKMAKVVTSPVGSASKNKENVLTPEQQFALIQFSVKSILKVLNSGDLYSTGEGVEFSAYDANNLHQRLFYKMKQINGAKVGNLFGRSFVQQQAVFRFVCLNIDYSSLSEDQVEHAKGLVEGYFDIANEGDEVVDGDSELVWTEDYKSVLKRRVEERERRRKDNLEMEKVVDATTSWDQGATMPQGRFEEVSDSDRKD